MATIANSQQPLARDGDTRTNDAQAPNDPFYQSTPRTSQPGMTSFLTNMQKVVPQQPVHPAAPPPQVRRTKIAACTHTVMARVYGPNICQNCGKIPSMGWLYTCRQDVTPPARQLSASESVDTLPTVSDSGSYFEAQAQIAASIGMSASIVKQMTEGAYTYDQVEILLAQRRHVLDTIRCIKHPSTSSVPPTPKSSDQASEQPENVIASVGTTAPPAKRTPEPVASRRTTAATSLEANQDLNSPAATEASAERYANTPIDSKTPTSQTEAAPVTTTESPKKLLKHKEACMYQVCHTCRPFFQDRLGARIGPVLSSADSALAEIEPSALPVHDAAVVSNLGLRRPLPHPPLHRSEESMDITMHHRNGTSYESFGQETSSDWTPTTSSEADSDVSEKLDLSPCPGAGVCPVWHPTEGCAYDNGFEDGRRSIAHGYSGGHVHGLGILDDGGNQADQLSGSITSTPDQTPSKGSSISLPNPPTTPMTDGTMSCSYSLPDRSSPCSNSSKSSRGSEVEVEGGVALTEEAVGMGTPDIALEN